MTETDQKILTIGTISVLDNAEIDDGIFNLASEFLQTHEVLELQVNPTVLLHHDTKSDAYYFTCHLYGEELASNCDLNATIDSDSETLYKLNRDVLKDKAAFKDMKKDAESGRSFEDIVLEYDPTYNEEQPLKVYGGQHRVEAIIHADSEEVNRPHGIRVYFNLKHEQKVEIARVNNTSIVVANDLLDRMAETFHGPHLRDWCQSIGLLEAGQDFKDKKDAVYPTVRIARTLIYNFYQGLSGSLDKHNQNVRALKTGSTPDEDYEALRTKIKWADPALKKMGEEYTRLHKAQMDKIISKPEKQPAEYARKALHISVVAGWAYAAGLFQKHAKHLDILFNLPSNAANNTDPLNAKALSEAKHKGHDPENYRGLGTRTTPREIGRVIELFIVMAKKDAKQINKQIANTAIKSYEAKRATSEAEADMAKI